MSLLITQFLSQLVLKGSLKHLLPAFFSMQLLKSVSILSIRIPAEIMIYLEQLRAFIDFEMLDPNDLMARALPGFDLADFLSGDAKKVQLTRDSE